jgi:FkbM family methyltransferase
MAPFRLSHLVAPLLVLAIVAYFGLSATSRRARERELHASSRAARRAIELQAAAAAQPPAPWSPPALDAPLSACLRDQAPRWREYLDGQLVSGLRDTGYLGGQFCNQCDREVLDTWSRLAKADAGTRPAVMLDIGANVGVFAAKFVESFPAMRLHSFELDPATFEQLAARRNSHPGRDRWSITNSGVAREEGKRQFYSGGGGSGLSSLGPLVSESNTLVLQSEQNITTVPAILKRLGLTYVDFCKIDVEGWEREVILGMDLYGAGAGSVGGMMFETGESWRDSRKGPSNLKLAEVVDLLHAAPPFGFACFFLGREDLLPISPPALATVEDDSAFSRARVRAPRPLALARAAPPSGCSPPPLPRVPNPCQ